MNWYNSLTSKGSMNWIVGFGVDVCFQFGVSCTATFPQKVKSLYTLFFFFFDSCLKIFTLSSEMFDILIVIRNFGGKGISGTISTEFGSLSTLEKL